MNKWTQYPSQDAGQTSQRPWGHHWDCSGRVPEPETQRKCLQEGAGVTQHGGTWDAAWHAKAFVLLAEVSTCDRQCITASHGPVPSEPTECRCMVPRGSAHDLGIGWIGGEPRAGHQMVRKQACRVGGETLLSEKQELPGSKSMPFRETAIGGDRCALSGRNTNTWSECEALTVSDWTMK